MGLRLSLQCIVLFALSCGLSELNIESESTSEAALGLPKTPTSLTATATSSNSIKLQWTDNSRIEIGYEVQRSSSATGTFTTIGSRLAANTTSYTNSGLSPGTYYYRVRAIGSNNRSGYSNVASAKLSSAGTGGSGGSGGSSGTGGSTGSGGSAAGNLASLTIGAHPQGGMYIGQYEWVPGDIAALESAGGRKVAYFHPRYGGWGVGYDNNGYPHFDLAAANAAWNDGKVIMVQAFNATPDPTESESPRGFTIDKLLAGQYDADLKRFAAELRAFGKPLFFTAGREPNGIGANYFGGFGPNGDQTLLWAIQQKKGLAEFKGGSATVCDGVERLKAAQRYYFDFFVKREGLKFLTFDTMGWATRQIEQTTYDLEDLPAGTDLTYAKTLLESCNDFQNFYPGNDVAHWVTLTFYTMDYLKQGYPGLPQDYYVPIDEWFKALDNTLSQVNAVAAGKPVNLIELGFPDGMNTNSAKAADKVTAGFTRLANNYPSVRGFALWSDHPDWFKVDSFPYACLIRPGTQQATALRNVFQSLPQKFRSCVYLSDGSRHPMCKE